MIIDNVFKLNLSLTTLSGITVAVCLWEHPIVKETVFQHLLKYKDWNDEAVEDWDEVIRYTIKQINFYYPEKLLSSIKHFIEILGHKLYNWIRYVIKVLKCDIKYTEKIYWTCNGEIDEYKIVEYWLRNSEQLGAIRHKCFLKRPLFCIAVAYVQKEFIHDHLEEMKAKLFQHLLVSHRKMNWNEYAVIATWIAFCQHKTKIAAVKYFRTFESFDCLPKLPARELFSISVKFDFKFAVQYFFEKLREEEEEDDKKQDLIDEAASDCWDARTKATTLYEKNHYMDILLFLIKISDTQLETLERNFICLSTVFLYMWPYQEICLNLLINNPDFSPDHVTLLERILRKFCQGSYEAKYFGKGLIFNQIFRILLDRIPKEAKKEIITKDNYKYLKSLKIFSYDVLNLIVNDPDLQDHRSDMIQVLETHLKKLLLDGCFEDVSNLVKLCSYEKLNSNTEKLNTLFTFLTLGRIKLAEKYLNWIYDSDCERLTVKKQIDFAAVCTNFIKKGRYDLASEYLNWQCDDKEEQENIKEIMISNGVLLDQVYQIWCMHEEPKLELVVGGIKKKCEELLSWFLKSEEAIIEFRKTKLVENESFIEKYWNNLFYHSSFECLGEFLKFCFWLPEEIEGLRQKIANNAEWWIDTYAADKNQFLMVDSLLDWVFPDDEKRIKVISEYMGSPKGALLILKSLKNINSSLVISRLFNTWIVVNDPFYIEKIKMNVDVSNSSFASDNIISSVKFLLDKIEVGDVILSSDICRLREQKLNSCFCQLGFVK